MKKISKPLPEEHALFYNRYLEHISPEIHVLDALKIQMKVTLAFYKKCNSTQLLYKYEPGKWSLKDILMHIIDVERVFLYRAMRFAREDKTPLPFFDEDIYAQKAQADKIPINKLLAEYKATRMAVLTFFNNLTAKQIKLHGIAGNAAMSVRACIWIIYAHEIHHKQVINIKYGMEF